MSDLRAGELINALASHVLFTHADLVQKDRGPGRLDARRLRRVQEYVDACIDDNITLEALSSAAALSLYHFARTFRATTRTTPHAFVTARRMEKARALVLGTELSTPDIAAQVGYVNVGHFRQSFRRSFGVTPAQMRASGVGAEGCRSRTQSVAIRSISRAWHTLHISARG